MLGEEVASKFWSASGRICAAAQRAERGGRFNRKDVSILSLNDPPSYRSTGIQYKRPGEIDFLTGQPLWKTAPMCQLMRRCVSTYAQSCVNLCAGVCQLMRTHFSRVSTYAHGNLRKRPVCQLMRTRVSTYAHGPCGNVRCVNLCAVSLMKKSARKGRC